MAALQFETLAVTYGAPGVAEVALNRPQQLNAMNNQFWQDMRDCFGALDADPECRVVILHQGECRIFSAGLDISSGGGEFDMTGEAEDPARNGLKVQHAITNPQTAISSVEKCRKPVICVVDGACIGGGVDLMCACDIRYCTSKSYFCIKEVAVGLAADIGTLQRLPKIIGNDSIVRELCYTARNMKSDEAYRLGLVSTVEDTRGAILHAARVTADQIAVHSPLAVLGTKVSLNYSRDHTTQEGLDHITQMNMLFLQSPDVRNAMIAGMTKQAAAFPKL